MELIELDLPPVVAAFTRRLRDAGVPAGAERSARLARALVVASDRRTGLAARRRLYWTARAVLVSDPQQVAAFDAVFAAVFGGSAAAADGRAPGAAGEPGPPAAAAPASDEGRPVEPGRVRDGGGAMAAGAGVRGGDAGEVLVPVPVVASDEEVLRGRRFDTLSPAEAAALRRLTARLAVSPPQRHSRRAQRCRRGPRIDLRRTLRDSRRTAGDPVRLARRRRRLVRRRLVLLCDISGSMAPYARVYLQFLASARGAETFTFATRLTRVTRALRTRDPERAIERAAAAAPDWSSGTRIGDALKAFNDRHGRRGLARGAVVVILSDGWERGDPSLVGREMERLSRLAHRIVWVNPRAAAPGFEPRVGGMAAALPFCDALLSGHTLAALEEVVDVIGACRFEAAPDVPEPQGETWGSATPVPGSSVAMPSGYGPSRGRTTPGW